MKHDHDPLKDGNKPESYKFTPIMECCLEQLDLSIELYEAIVDVVGKTGEESPERHSCVIFSALVNALVDLIAAAVAKGETKWATTQTVRMVEAFEKNFPNALIVAVLDIVQQKQMLMRMPVDSSRIN